MTNGLFKEGGPHKIRRTGRDEYTMNISLPVDADGRQGRECPSISCSPGYFKVTPGTGITENHEEAFCPYCCHSKEPNDFITEEQMRYAKDLAIREAQQGVENLIGDAFGLKPGQKKKMGGGLISIEMSYKPGSKHPVRRPFEEDIRRDVICPYCNLDHSVFGLAIWCADCGKDIFLTHVKAEQDVTIKMLDDVKRRRKDLGVRIAAKDIENCLEDTVSIFEAVLKAILRRHYSEQGDTDEEIEKLLSKKVRNGFQNVKRAQEIYVELLNIDPYAQITQQEVENLSSIYEKRHPITHNLGVVDRKFIQKARTAEKEGREILVTTGEIKTAIKRSFNVFQSLHERLFPEHS